MKALRTSLSSTFSAARRARTLLFLLLPVTIGIGQAAAQAQSTPDQDTLTFTNGDQLTGKVVSEAGGVVTFQNDASFGKLTVPWSKIKELHTAQKFAVITSSEKLRQGKPAPEVPVGPITYTGDQISVAEAGGQTKTVAAKDAAYVVNASEFENAMQHEPGMRQGWLGSASLGASLVQGTQTQRTFTGNLGLVRTAPSAAWLAPRNKTIFDASAAYATLTQPALGSTAASSAKTNILHGDLEHDWFLSPRFFALLDASADHNLGSGLKIQQTYGGGFGYAVLRQPAQTLDLKSDIHFSRQDFYPASPNVAGVSLDLVGLSVGEIYMRKLRRGMVFNESGTVQPAFNHPSALTAQFIAGLVFPVYKNLGFSLGTQDNYLNNPPAGYKNNTFLFTAGLNYTFK